MSGENQQAKCRGCGLLLIGMPYYQGGVAKHPETKELCKSSFWGGFVCSDGCEREVDRDMKIGIERHQNSNDYCDRD